MSSRYGAPNDKFLHDLADELVDLLHARGVLRSCPECMHWNMEQERCDRFMARPPASVIAKGCDDYEPDIPF